MYYNELQHWVYAYACTLRTRGFLEKEDRLKKRLRSMYVRSWRGFEEILSHEYHKKNKLRLGKGGFGKGVWVQIVNNYCKVPLSLSLSLYPPPFLLLPPSLPPPSLSFSPLSLIQKLRR